MTVDSNLGDRHHLPFGDDPDRGSYWGSTTDLRNKVSQVAFVALIGKANCRNIGTSSRLVSLGLHELHLLIISV
jgi:hypothetical protein